MAISPGAIASTPGEGCWALDPCDSGFSCHPGRQECYHAPRQEGEPCMAGYECGSGLQCEAGTQECKRPAQLGESCHATHQCDSGLSCQPGVHKCYHETREIGEPCVAGYECGEGLYCQSFKQVCAPKTVDFDGDSACSSLYVQATAEDAKRAGLTMSFGGGTSMSAGASVSYETGLVYGDQGQFGCYASVCAGFTGDVEISDFINMGISTSWDQVEGWSYVTGQSVDTPLAKLGFQTSQVWDASPPSRSRDFHPTELLTGTASGFSLGVGLAPVAAGQAMCYTALLDSGDPLDQFSDIEGLLKGWAKAGFAPEKMPAKLKDGGDTCSYDIGISRTDESGTWKTITTRAPDGSSFKIGGCSAKGAAGQSCVSKYGISEGATLIVDQDGHTVGEGTCCHHPENSIASVKKSCN